MTKQDFIDFGFRDRGDQPFIEDGEEIGKYHLLSKMINTRQMIPFYIKLESLFICDNKEWRLFKTSKDEQITICYINSIEELKKAIYVITDFEYSDFTI